MQNTLNLIRQKVGHGNIKKFIREEMGMDYRLFLYQCENGCMKYKVIVVLIEKLGIKFEDFSTKEFSDLAVHKSKDKAKIRKDITMKAQLKELNISKPQKLSNLLG